jgi:hypothetical protein
VRPGLAELMIEDLIGRMAALLAPGPVLLKLAATGFGVRLPAGPAVTLRAG